MAEDTEIQWADSTHNFWNGCTKVSPGCAHCYAWMRDQRFGGDHWGVGKPRRRTTKANWRKPYQWRKRILESGSRRERVFPSLMDPFDLDVPLEWHRDMMQVIADTSDALDWLLVTKRPENIPHILSNLYLPEDFLLNNKVWLMVSVENPDYLWRVDGMVNVPAALYGISAEPLLERVDFTGAFSLVRCGKCGKVGRDGLRCPHCLQCASTTPAISWCIVGGESQSGARSANIGWMRTIVEDCRGYGVTPFVKQLGKSPVHGTDDKNPFPILNVRHPKGGDMDEWPADLRVREFPVVR